MSDRLAELVRQRALVQEHLAWLNREIAAAAETAKAQQSAVPSIPAAAAPLPPVPPLPTLPTVPPPAVARSAVARSDSASAAPVDADEIMARYQAAPGTVKQDVRKGCFLYFAGAFVLLGIGVALLYLVLSARH